MKAPDEDDWGKLVRVLKYINGSWYMKLIISADEMNFTVHWYVDGSHQIHEDCRGQVGCLMMGEGSCDQFIEYDEMQHCRKPSDQPRDAARREECSNRMKRVFSTFYRCDGRAKGIC